MTDAEWREKHAEIHGELQVVLKHLDKNMDELKHDIELNRQNHLHCREEVIREITAMKTTAVIAAKAEAKKWAVVVAIISSILGIIGGVVISALTGGAY